MKKTKLNKLQISFLLIFVFSLGMIGGIYLGVNLVIDRFMNIMPNFVDIKINRQAITDALFMYNNRIEGCFSSIPKL